MVDIEEEDVFILLITHRKFYRQDMLSSTDDEGLAAPFAEDLIKQVGISMTKDMGRNFFRAIGILDDHVDGMISTKTAVRKLKELV